MLSNSSAEGSPEELALLRELEQTTSGSYNREEVVALAKRDLNFFASLMMPLQFTIAFPSLHNTVWEFLLQKVGDSEAISPTPKQKFPQLGIGWPRAHAKTTLVKLFVLWCIFFSKKKFILVVCSNSAKAENLISDIADMLSEDNVRNVFGDWSIALDKNTATLKKFYFMGRDITIGAIGSGGDPRGLNIKNERPDVIVMDDMQSKENSESPTQAKQLLSWMNSTLKKAKSPHGCIFIYVGNMFSSPGCILKIIRNNPEWTSVIVAGILADGSALWPELRSKEELIQELREDLAMGTPEAFFSEIMNDENAGVTSCFDITKVPVCPFTDLDKCYASFCIIDVATDKIGADDTTIIYYEVFDGIPVATTLVLGVMTPEDTILETLRICLKTGCPLVAVEDVAYQTSLLFWFKKTTVALGIAGIFFVPVKPRGRSKNSRILQMFKRLIGSSSLPNAKEGRPSLYIKEDLKPKVFWEITQFKPSKTDNTDNIIDNLAYTEDVLMEYADLIINPLAPETQEFNAARVLEDNTAF